MLAAILALIQHLFLKVSKYFNPYTEGAVQTSCLIIYLLNNSDGLKRYLTY